MENKNKSPTALITGASSGIGYELAKLFAQDGYNLVLTARRRDRLAQLANELVSQSGIQAKVLAKDLSQPTAAQEIFDELQQSGVQVDALVNNAGYGMHGDFAEMELSKVLDMIRVNLVTLTQLTRLFLPGMAARGRGKILNVGSTGSFLPVPLSAVYGATKAYVLSFSEALAHELSGSGVTVTALCPGATSTEFHQRTQAPDIRLLKFGAMDAKIVARTGYRGLMRGKKVVIPGAFNQLQIFSTRFTPRSVTAALTKVMMTRG